MQLQSYLAGRWQSGSGRATALRDASTGELVAEASSEGLDFRGVLDHARAVGGPARAYAERHWSLRTMMSRYVALLERLVVARGALSPAPS